MVQMVNNIQLTWKFASLLRTYKTCNLTFIFLKYEFYNKLLGNVTLFEPNPIYIYWSEYLFYIGNQLESYVSSQKKIKEKESHVKHVH